jgi:hypothetical protein
VSPSLIHRYQRVFFDEMERQRGALPGGSALGWVAHLDRVLRDVDLAHGCDVGGEDGPGVK